jgi:hypothetical protein
MAFAAFKASSISPFSIIFSSFVHKCAHTPPENQPVTPSLQNIG